MTPPPVPGPDLLALWDDRADAIAREVTVLAALAVEDKENRLRLLRETTAGRAAACDDADLCFHAWLLTEALAKTGNRLTDPPDNETLAYLTHTTAVLLDEVQRRGYRLMVSLELNYGEALGAPVQVLPSWYTAAGFLYLCPQHLAYRRGLEETAESGAALAALAGHLPWALTVCASGVQAAREAATPLLFLEAGADGSPRDPDPLAPTVEAYDPTRDLLVARDTPPVAGSRALVVMPAPLRAILKDRYGIED